MLLLLLLSLSQQVQAQVIDRVYARVGDDVITKFDVESLNPERTKAIYAIADENEKNRVLAEYTKKTLDFLVDQYVVLNSARREGVRVSDQEVDNAVKDVLEKNSITEQQLLDVLARENRTMARCMASASVSAVSRCSVRYEATTRPASNTCTARV
ncbi:MAG: SurA N-terminal domain-containing protein [Geovibrio sp.]|nr:SurA N-terminal domain-containing protein [Geovibrio sp.]